MHKFDVFEANGAKFYAQNDMIVKWVRRFRRPFEPETTKFIFSVLKDRGGTFIDVGAGTGWFTIPAALRGFDVVALEPNVRVWARLKENVDLNQAPWDRIELLNKAASNEPGRATFFYNPDVPLTSGGSIEAATCSRPLREDVERVTLDSLKASGVGLIKVDVEGHERWVLEGASRLIAEERPHLVLEANTLGFEGVLAMWLSEHGYSWVKADERNLLCSPIQ